MKCRCGSTIPEARIQYGYTECTQCSTVEAHGCIDIIYHKTGNTIQITDKKTAERMRSLSRRSGFGTLRGMGAGKTETFKTTIKKDGGRVARVFVPNNNVFEEVGKEALILMETEGYDSALIFLQKKVSKLLISNLQMNKIKGVLIALNPIKENLQKLNPGWYSKNEPRTEKGEVGTDIINAFRCWK